MEWNEWMTITRVDNYDEYVKRFNSFS